MGNLVTIDEENAEQAQRMTQDVGQLIAQSENLQIQHYGDLENAQQIRKQLKDRNKTLEEARKRMTDPLNLSIKRIMDLFSVPQKALKRAYDSLDIKILDYDRQEKAKLLAEQRKMEAIAEEKARKEREKLAAQAQKAEAKGNIEKAEMFREKQDEVEVYVPILAPVPKVAGLSYRTLWSAEVIDVGLIPREYMIPDIEALKKIAVATKGTISVPGVKFISRQVVAGR